jgi:hypothetical protein
MYEVVGIQTILDNRKLIKFPQVGDCVNLLLDGDIETVDNIEIVLGKNQDKSSNKLFGYANWSPRSFVLPYTYIFVFQRIKDKKFQITHCDTYFILSWGWLKDLPSSTYSIIRFIREEGFPFYIENDNVYSKKHKVICESSYSLTEMLAKDRMFRISPNRYLFYEHLGNVLALYWDDQIKVIQSSKYIPFSNDAIFMDHILFNQFELTETILNQLKTISSLEDAVKYLKRELTYTWF